MATRRKRANTKAGHRPPARRKGTRAKGARAHGRTRGSRQSRAAQSSREVRGRARAAAALGPPTVRLVERAGLEEGTGRSDAADREAAELARRIEASVGSASETLRTGPENAPDVLREHREHMEAAARRREPERELPGAASIGLELAVGALRLVGSMAAAPLRIGLAFLRR